MSKTATSSAPRAWIRTTPEAEALRIWGLSPAERLERALRAAGCPEVTRLPPGSAAGPDPDEPALVLRGDLIFDARLVAALLQRPGVLLCAAVDPDDPAAQAVAAHTAPGGFAEARDCLRGGGELPADLERAAPPDLADDWVASLRKSEPARVIAVDAADIPALEQQLFGSAYKTITDLVTRWAWPAPAARVVRALAERRIHPNWVTALSWVLTIAAAGLFAAGHFGVGLLCAWGMTFLDTVDGKLARVTLTASRAGHVADHGLDLIHPPFWYWAWAVGASGGIDAAAAVVIAGYLLGRGLEGVFMLAFGVETHCWRPIDNLFRTITARRNPNLILLTVAALAGAPAVGMEMVAWWTAASLGFHLVRLAQAFRARSRGEVVRAWDEAPAPPARPSSHTAKGAGA